MDITTIIAVLLFFSTVILYWKRPNEKIKGTRISIRRDDGNDKNLVSLYDRIHFDTLDIEKLYNELESAYEPHERCIRTGQYLKINNLNYMVVAISFEMITSRKNTFSIPMKMSADDARFHGNTFISEDIKVLPYNCIIHVNVKESYPF